MCTRWQRRNTDLENSFYKNCGQRRRSSHRRQGGLPHPKALPVDAHRKGPNPRRCRPIKNRSSRFVNTLTDVKKSQSVFSDSVDRLLVKGIEESLAIPCRYSLACKDLSFILRHAYNKLPKTLQSQIFQHLILAFRLLPGMERKDAEAAANLLSQSAEAALPKQKKVQAVKHFKTAKVALKKRIKARHKDTGSANLPEDVLVHVFSFLDLRSLLHVAQVCWAWHSAAGDNHLWKQQYDVIFGEAEMCPKLQYKMPSRSIKLSLVKDTSIDSVNWRESLKNRLTGISSKFKFHRGYCQHCGTIVWLNNLKCDSENVQLGAKRVTHLVKPVKVAEVSSYLKFICVYTLMFKLNAENWWLL
uniref:F-box domain-containing protein n=1 Tax=Kalanchoe fedtschenkoi TaxID=63787 RepID=A0A7N0V8V3_KALFE